MTLEEHKANILRVIANPENLAGVNRFDAIDEAFKSLWLSAYEDGREDGFHEGYDDAYRIIGLAR